MTLPPQLTDYSRWITWRSEDGTKKPNCKWSDPIQWLRFDEVSEFEKIGFVFIESDGLCGIDLDDCIAESGDWNNESIGIMSMFEGVAYAEISPSGTGCKLITRAKKPSWAKCTNNAGVECYDKGRWFAITQKQVEGYSEIGDGQEALNWLCEKYLKNQDPPKRTENRECFSSSPKDLLERAAAYVDNADRPAQGGRNNAAFRLAGHLIGFVDHSGDRLSKSDVSDLMHRWNNNLPSPIGQKELESVIESASKNGTPRDDKPENERVVDDYSDIDISAILRDPKTVGDETDEEFCIEMISQAGGIIGQIVNYYRASAYRESPIMALAVAIALCETLFGRRVCSESGLRTNDYNVILASTGSGKEACETAISKILESADPKGRHIVPGDIQSGNGLMKALSVNPCAIWVCDEFGKIMQSILDKKGNQHIKNIGNHLLKLYSKSGGTYGGAAHSDGIRNRVNQPNLSVLGLSTSSTIFDCITAENVTDGMFGRIAWWPVQERPEPKKRMVLVPVPQQLSDACKVWLDWYPGGNLASENPEPVVLKCSTNAIDRWDSHSDDINQRMANEPEARAAIWARAAARALKLAICHRLSRLGEDPAQTNFEYVYIEIIDMNWAIRLSNWLATISCSLVRENLGNRPLHKAMEIVRKAVANGTTTRREITRAFRGVSAGDVHAAAQALGLVIVVEESKRGVKQYTYSLPGAN